MKKLRQTVETHVCVDVDVDVEQVLDDLPLKDLQNYLRARSGLAVADALDSFAWDDFAADLRAAFRDRDAMHFEVLLIRARAALLARTSTSRESVA